MAIRDEGVLPSGEELGRKENPTADAEPFFRLFAVFPFVGHGGFGIVVEGRVVMEVVFFGKSFNFFSLVQFDLGEKAMVIKTNTTFAMDGVTAAPVWIYFEYKTV